MEGLTAQSGPVVSVCRFGRFGSAGQHGGESTTADQGQVRAVLRKKFDDWFYGLPQVIVPDDRT